MYKDLYSKTSQEINSLITRRYSTSFSAAIKLVDEPYRSHIYNIYGFVRLADELVDTLKPQNGSQLLDELLIETKRAIKSQISLNPVVHAFAITVVRYKIDIELIQAFFKSMEYDLDKKNYSKLDYDKYIYGSAEVVGLMCLKVFVGGNQTKYKQLLSGAKTLGSAFQKVNFLRDIRADNKQLGRMYFPGLNFSSFSQTDKRAIESDISKEFKNAKRVINKLPRTSRYGVYLAFCYYTALLKAISKSEVDDIKTGRIRVSNFRKITLFVYVFILKLLHI
jgi:phytoene/squalene synthetase